MSADIPKDVTTPDQLATLNLSSADVVGQHNVHSEIKLAQNDVEQPVVPPVKIIPEGVGKLSPSQRRWLENGESTLIPSTQGAYDKNKFKFNN
jgi:hypothetical protein